MPTYRFKVWFYPITVSKHKCLLNRGNINGKLRDLTFKRVNFVEE